MVRAFVFFSHYRTNVAGALPLLLECHAMNRDAPHHVYDETTNLESFSVSRTDGLILAEAVYVEDVTRICSKP